MRCLPLMNTSLYMYFKPSISGPPSYFSIYVFVSFETDLIPTSASSASPMLLQIHCTRITTDPSRLKKKIAGQHCPRLCHSCQWHQCQRHRKWRRHRRSHLIHPLWQDPVVPKLIVHSSEFYLMDSLAGECWFVISLSLFPLGRIGERVRGGSVSAKIHRSRTSRELWFLTGGTV